jgi:geranylgeranyl reductase family protein
MQYDVAIVGAGPAGSTAAKFLSDQGIRTILLEKTTFPRDKPCGGGLQMRVVRQFKYIEENSLVDSYSNEIQLHSSSMKDYIDLQYHTSLQAMVLRKTFDEGLVNCATQSGVFLQCGKAVTGITNEKDKIRLFFSNGATLESRLVIGADGIWSTIGKIIGVKQDCHHIGVCAYNEYPLSHKTLTHLYGDQRCVHIHLQPQGLAGYGWVFPKKEHVNIGVVEFRQAISPGQEKKNLQTSFAHYLKPLKDQKLVPKNLSIKKIHGGAFPTCQAKQLAADRVLLCGDAGGLVNPLTGEGIYYAMRSGEIAAKIAIKALENNTTDSRSLRQYQRQWKHEFRMDFSFLSRLSKRWGRNVDNLVGLVSKDSKFIDIACDAIPSPEGIQKEKWKLVQRLIVIYCKNRLGMR